MRTISLSKRSHDKLLHVEAPGCIVNIQIELEADGRPLTRVDVLADADRYAGEEPWWARGSVSRSGGVVLVEQWPK